MVSKDILVKKRNGRLEKIDIEKINKCVQRVCKDIEGVSENEIISDAHIKFYDKIKTTEIDKALIMSAGEKIEKDPNYSLAAAQLYLNTIYKEIFGEGVDSDVFEMQYRKSFVSNMKVLVKADRLDSRLLELFDLKRLADALVIERDKEWEFRSIKIVYDRYLLHINKRRLETPQAWLMRVAMGLCYHEENPTEKAIEFYEILSQKRGLSGTPTLFNSGTTHSQLSSCYLSTIDDSIDGIYGTLHGQARLSKYAGGLGIDWTYVRSTGSYIQGTNGESQGVIPFMKSLDSLLIAVNQCFHPETLVFSDKGIVEIQDIDTGDLVLGLDGEYRKVNDVMIYEQKNEDMYEVDVKHSIDKIKVTGEHPLYAIQGVPYGQSNNRTLKQLEKGHICADWTEVNKLSRGDFIAYPIPQDSVFNPEISLDDAYMYGLMLGDGHILKNGHEVGISFNIDKDLNIIEFVKSYLRNKGIHYWDLSRDKYYQIRWSNNGKTPFGLEDLYDNERKKRISKKFLHLPSLFSQQIVKGLIDSDGDISRNKEISFTSTSRQLVEGLRYLLLKLGIPTAGNKRNREYDHDFERSDGTLVKMPGTSICYDLRIPAVGELAKIFGVKEIKKKNWFVFNNLIFTRIKDIKLVDSCDIVFDLKVDGSESYTTSSGLAHNGGKRKGAGCAYLETWHMDIEDFLDLRKNTGDDRRRTHDMHTANWIPDLFMERVEEGGDWYLFSPVDVPDLHDLYGEEFKKRYIEYSDMADKGKIRTRKLKARDLFQKMLRSIFETGHPWITFKDPCNLRSPQQHCGVVHSSNLCTEITLNTKPSKYHRGAFEEVGETAVCNLASINVAAHVKDGKMDWKMLEETVSVMMRMLDNVIDINYYPTREAENSNLRHRPVGLGLMGFHTTLYELNINYDSDEAVEFSGLLQEHISYYAIMASSKLAEERGTYETYSGSLWDQGRLPLDTYGELMKYRGVKVPKKKLEGTLKWDKVRKQIKEHGMRNSNTMAIAPTATISYICGVSQSIEPDYSTMYTYQNLSGDSIMVNKYFVNDMKERELWGQELIDALKLADGDVSNLNLPEDIKDKYKTSFNIPQKRLIDCAAERQIHIDQGQSLNLYLAVPNGARLMKMYLYAFKKGLKTTYYLRSLGASSIEKSTVAKRADKEAPTEEEKTVCSLEAMMTGGICDACQ